MAEQQPPNGDGGIGVLLGAAMIFFITPIIFKMFVLPYYAVYWYYPKYYLFKALWMVSEHPVGHYLVEIPYVWVKLFFWDFSLPANEMTSFVRNSFKLLRDVDTASAHSIRDSIFSESSLTTDYTMVGRLYFSYVAPIYVYIFYVCWRKMRNADPHETVFTLDTFAIAMSRCVPEILPVVYDNPQLHPDLHAGHWRASPKPYRYLEDRGCIKSSGEGEDFRFELKETPLTRLLIEQLGDRFTGINQLPISYWRIVATAIPMVASPSAGKITTNELTALYAKAFSSKPTYKSVIPNAFKAAINPKTYLTKKGGGISSVIKAFMQIPESIDEGLAQAKYLRQADRLAAKTIKKFADHPKVKAVICKHAYESTVVSALIETARDGGVLPSCSFLWLKLHDRKLFYVFNNIGRDVCWVEVVGFWSHYIAEVKTGMPFPYPKVLAGVKGVDDYFESSFYTYNPIP